MKRRILLLVVTVLVLFCSTVVFSAQYDFRKTNWGMSKEEVGAVEEAKVFKYEGKSYPGTVYDTNVGGFDCFIHYYYIDNKLVRAKYDFGYDATEKDVCIRNYENLKETLINKYGEPINDEYIWIDDLYKDDPDSWGVAVKKGDLVCYADWETATTRITIFLRNEDYNIGLEIRYRSKELKKLEEEAKGGKKKVIQQEKRDYEVEIKAYARKKWPDDYEMQVYEYNNQMKALNQIRNLPSTTDYNESILLKAMTKWGEDYEMVIYEYNNQLEAYKKMR